MQNEIYTTYSNIYVNIHINIILYTHHIFTHIFRNIISAWAWRLALEIEGRFKCDSHRHQHVTKAKHRYTWGVGRHIVSIVCVSITRCVFRTRFMGACDPLPHRFCGTYILRSTCPHIQINYFSTVVFESKYGCPSSFAQLVPSFAPPCGRCIWFACCWIW